MHRIRVCWLVDWQSEFIAPLFRLESKAQPQLQYVLRRWSVSRVVAYEWQIFCRCMLQCASHYLCRPNVAVLCALSEYHCVLSTLRTDTHIHEASIHRNIFRRACHINCQGIACWLNWMQIMNPQQRIMSCACKA